MSSTLVALSFGIAIGAVVTRGQRPLSANPKGGLPVRSIRSTLFGTRRRALLSILVCLALPAAAWAAWSIISSGAGGAKVGSLQAPTVANTATLTADLLPASTPTGTLTLSVTNPNAAPLKVYGVALKTGGTITEQGSSTGCNPSLVTLPSQTGLAITVPPGGPTKIEVPKAVQLAAAAPQTCEGASFNIPVDVTFST